MPGKKKEVVVEEKEVAPKAVAEVAPKPSTTSHPKTLDELLEIRHKKEDEMRRALLAKQKRFGA